jgi:SAM-dependent methyltransferase
VTPRALRFGAIADRYERFRPGYPDAVVAEVLAYAGRPLRDALEIGAGTGKATRRFAAHGIAVTATEPDAEMVAVLRQQVPPTTTIVTAPFEDIAVDRTYDLVFAAAALHWTAPERRWERVAALLAPQGVFACLGGAPRLADAALDAAVHAARTPWLPDDDIPPPDGTPPDGAVQWPGTELTRSPLFTDVRQSRVEHRLRLSDEDYVGLLSTVSAYLELPEPDRRQVLASIGAVLPAELTVVADIDLHLARLA